MKIGAIGCNYKHEPDFCIDSPEGTGCGLMLIIKSPARFVINGQEIIAEKNSFVMFTPQTPCRYGGIKDNYMDDWVYFDYEENDIERFAELGIPLNEIAPLINVEEMSQILRQIAYEHHSQDENRDIIEKHYVEIFLLKLSRILNMNSTHHSVLLADKHYHFSHLRNKIYSNPEEMTNVSEIARQMGMSYSGFQHLYKKIFGVSVMSDIKKSRFELAARLLVTTNLSVKDIAHKCGYISEYSFMRKFKEIYCKTPSEYRRMP